MFHIRGVSKKISNKYYKDKDLEGIKISSAEMRFDLEIVIQDEEIEFDISIRKINLATVDRIFKFTNNSIIYLTNLRAVLENSNEGQIKLKFINRTNTKIFALPQN